MNYLPYDRVKTIDPIISQTISLSWFEWVKASAIP